jgi:sirohydrochlorin ferrochelatase
MMGVSPMELVILVDHGSPFPEANRSVELLAERLRDRLGKEVIATHMEIASPLFHDLLDSLMIQPALKRLTVVPLFISGGKHLNEDILKPLDRFIRAFPDAELKILPPLAEQIPFLDYLYTLLTQEEPSL